MAHGLVLAIEGGGTQTRVVLGGEHGGVMREARGGPGSALYVDAEAYPRELAALLDEVLLGEAPVRGGGAGPVNQALIEQVLARRLPGLPFRWYSEGEIALGVYALDWGVSVVGGTGSSARAVAPGGAWVEVGGFGPQFDDLGSGYWLAREGIAAVLRAEHGRGPATALRAQVFEHFGISDPWELVPMCAGNGHIAVTRVAACAPRVTACAEGGDVVALSLCGVAAGHLADLVHAAARRAGIAAKAEVPVVATGGLFSSDMITGPFRAALAPNFLLRKPVPDPVIGLLNLLTRR